MRHCEIMQRIHYVKKLLEKRTSSKQSGRPYRGFQDSEYFGKKLMKFRIVGENINGIRGIKIRKNAIENC